MVERWSGGERFRFFLFYGHKPPEVGVDASCLSQWFVRDFQIDGDNYPTAEHWMMAEKARLFDDAASLERILACETPREAKALGRKVIHFDPAVWDQHKFDIVYRGNSEKFSQNEDMAEFLRSTAWKAHPAQQEIATGESPVRAVAEEPAPFSVVRPDQLSDVILVEAAGRDTVWGIGLGVNNPKSLDPNLWRGQNLLGFALTQVRDTLPQ